MQEGTKVANAELKKCMKIHTSESVERIFFLGGGGLDVWLLLDHI